MIDTAEIDERIAKCERILKDNPHSQIFAALADAHRKKGELDAAFRTCRQGLRIHPDYGPAHLVMARINFDRKMYDWAERELQEAIKIDGRSRVTDILEVEILIKQGFYTKAGVRLQELTSTDPKNEYFRSLRQDIEVGKAGKKAKLAETEDFYRAGVSEGRAAEEAQDSADGYESMTYDKALEIMAEFPTVDTVFYADFDGLVESSAADDSVDIDTYSAALTEICRFIDSSINADQYGKWQDVFLENGRRAWLMIRLPDRILVLVCDRKVNLGSLRLRLARVFEALGSS